MIRGKIFYFFRLTRHTDDFCPDYRIAESIDDLKLRLGELYVSQFSDIEQLNEVTMDHIIALELFINQQLR